MTKNNVFVGKGYCNPEFFVLNISYVINENASSSTYITDSISLWYAILIHANISYITKMHSCDLISSINNNMDKCKICVVTNNNKKKK